MNKFSNKNYIRIARVAFILLILPLRSFASCLRPMLADFVLPWIWLILALFLIPAIILLVIGSKSHKKILKYTGISVIILFIITSFLYLFVLNFWNDYIASEAICPI